MLSSLLTKNSLFIRTNIHQKNRTKRNYNVKEKMKDVPDLKTFMKSQVEGELEEVVPNKVPYLDNSGSSQRSFFVETYGCQMNVADTEIVNSIMMKSGYNVSENADSADIVFLNTCAIREKAEDKIWQRLNELRKQKIKRRKTNPLTVGVLGCMAERLKTKILESDKLVDIVVGPDAYRDIPNLIADIDDGSVNAINVILSQDETYADITPVRVGSNGVSAFVSIMRGCNNMCTYCIVPFTRGRERSRPATSIENEIRELSALGYREVTLLGQNVNSYNDISSFDDSQELPAVPLPDGFKTVYKRPKMGVNFTELVDRVSQIDPNMRIRFTSPHPKDFPDDLIKLLKERPNVCNSIHIPVQSGSTTVLERMRRGYTREAYLNLIDRIRSISPDITLSSDFISGFCGETEEEHEDTVSLMKQVEYDIAFMFAYSLREKTPAHRKLEDDVPQDVKLRRLQEVNHTFFSIVKEKVKKEIGKEHLVLIENTSNKSESNFVGKTDNNRTVVFPKDPLLNQLDGTTRVPQKGEYVCVTIKDVQGLTLHGEPHYITDIVTYHQSKTENTTPELKENTLG
eukprot:TRINITY_DN1254_c0_g1_i1.p1 TRINITY_DN1254_c0_g1~~TRINITY_DN1254_c0_g1_i1.p1  ORF type:complete len:572 (+),score=134.95 TRINITY_DN1254_c0_g1_i1:275-1990(+)